MTQITRRASHTTNADEHRRRRAPHSPSREARVRRSFDGVVASYIRELSAAAETTAATRSERGLHAT